MKTIGLIAVGVIIALLTVGTISGAIGNIGKDDSGPSVPTNNVGTNAADLFKSLGATICMDGTIAIPPITCPAAPGAAPTVAAAQPTMASQPTQAVPPAEACLAGDKIIISRATLDLDEPGYMVVDFYLRGDPQGVTALPFNEANGGSYTLKSGTKGAYWIYPSSCSFDDVVDEAEAHATDLVEDGYNMMDPPYQGWESSGFFVKK